MLHVAFLFAAKRKANHHRRHCDIINSNNKNNTTNNKENNTNTDTTDVCAKALAEPLASSCLARLRYSG